MITKLTKEQESKIPVYLDKWLKIGLRTQTVDREKVTPLINWLYLTFREDKPKKVIFLDSPMACQLASDLVKDDSQLYYPLNSQLYSQLSSQLSSKLYSQLSSHLNSQLYDQIYSQLYSQIDSQLRSQLDSQIDSQLRSQLDSQLSYQYQNVFWSNFWNSYYGQYDYILHELFPDRIKEFPIMKNWLELISNTHQIYTFKNVCYISDFPINIHRNKENKLHKEDGLALEYRDGYGVYSLNSKTFTKEEYNDLTAIGRMLYNS